MGVKYMIELPTIDGNIETFLVMRKVRVKLVIH